MQKIKRIIPLLLTLVLLGLASPSPVSGEVGAGALVNCAEYGFSVEEDFVTQGPEPADGNPIISDGDLLGLVFDTETVRCAICARNADLLQPTFDVSVDIGLDAVDVLDVDAYIVAFSTELDSPNLGQFTAGDLLVTNGAIIPNEALTYAFGMGPMGYDLGLDAVHFTGGKAAILDFMATAAQTPRSGWLQPLDLLATLLTSSGIDIWYSTEGDVPGLQDGDLVSAKTGVIVASQGSLFLPGVPAGLPNGIDFGLDAVTSDRGTEPSAIHFSTEILYAETPSFSDGDVLKIGEGVVATNWEHMACFEPVEAGQDFGLDALSVTTSSGCTSQITEVGDVGVGDIGPDGLILPGTLIGMDAPAPFGGQIDIRGTLCDDVETYRVVYRLQGSADPWQPIGVGAGKNWTAKVDSFIPPYPDCLGTQNWFSDGSGWFDAADYRHLTLPGLGGCNNGLALTVWDSTAAVDGSDKLYELQLETTSTGGSITGGAVQVQLDNTPPTVELQKASGVCSSIDGSEMPYTFLARMKDDYFYKYQLQIAGDGYGIYHYTPVTYYDDPGDNVIATGTTNWNLFMGLHEVNIFDLVANPTSCGFVVRLDGWDRAHDCDFTYAANFGSCCTACRHVDDMWVFNFSP